MDITELRYFLAVARVENIHRASEKLHVSPGSLSKAISRLELTGGSGVDVAYDAIGTTLIETISLTKAHGSIVYYGQAGGPPPSIDPNLLMAGSKVLVGGELWSHISNKEALFKRAETLFSWVKEGQLTLSSLTKYPLSRAAEAHLALEGGKTQGKILLMPEEES